jgi:hypothetical protein
MQEPSAAEVEVGKKPISSEQEDNVMSSKGSARTEEGIQSDLSQNSEAVKRYRQKIRDDRMQEKRLQQETEEKRFQLYGVTVSTPDLVTREMLLERGLRARDSFNTVRLINTRLHFYLCIEALTSSDLYFTMCSSFQNVQRIHG